MQLLKQSLLKNISSDLLDTKSIDIGLPEKVLQFGTGVLLRGLPDYYIDKANKEGIFNGRIVVVKSTGGNVNDFAEQDNLYTHCIKGIEGDKITEGYIINSSVSRVISAKKKWQQVLDCAANPELQIIISNTTEVGIVLNKSDDMHAAPPQSFPGKLLAFLYQRYHEFKGSNDSGLVIIPTELIIDNGSTLKNIVLQLTNIHQLDKAFIEWLSDANDWCNSLVDRIVPGALPQHEKEQLEKQLGYKDELAIMSEPYNLWAIKTNKPRTKNILSFSQSNDGIIIAPNITKYRELKLRLLNGTHTFSCGLAFLYGFNTVTEAMQNNIFNRFVTDIMMQETIPCLVANNINSEEAKVFASNVINRFANPFIQHKWLSITLQYTGKMKLRCVPLIKQYYELHKQPPMLMALGFAAYLLFMKATIQEDDKYFGERTGERYLIQDDKAAYYFDLWQQKDIITLVSAALSNVEIWGEDLNQIKGFTSMVVSCLNKISDQKSIDDLLTTFTSNH